MQKLAWKKRKMEEEGEMGVGTLLIFIAMILVAAVAAGVLVQTAYKLQQQAEQTGEQALQEVATGVKVLAVWAETDADSEITVLHIKVTLTAGSPDINLLYTTIEAVKTVGDTTWEVSMEHSVLVSGYLTETYTTTLLRDMNPVTDTGETMMSAGDIFEITIDMAGFTVAASLLTQDQIDISIMPKHGIPTYCTIVAPSTLPVSGFVSLK